MDTALYVQVLVSVPYLELGLNMVAYKLVEMYDNFQL